MTAPPFNLAAVEAATDIALDRGHRVLQTHFYAESEREHIAVLLDAMNPPHGAIVLDAGCGIGEVSRLMAEMRQDLAFVLLNISPYQMSFCPTGERFHAIIGDCHDLDIADASVDAVMFSSALCQMDEDLALAEAARVLKDGGLLLVNDMARSQDDNGAMEQALAARVLTQGELIDAIEQAGFSIETVTTPDYSDAHFRQMLADDGMEHLIQDIIPIIIRAVKGKS